VRDEVGVLAKPDFNGLLAEPRRRKILGCKRREARASAT